ncbi:MDR family MFS transporter [Heyndrickxia sporothermodurans]
MKFQLWDMNLKFRFIGETLFNLFYWMYFPFITVYFAKALGNHTAGILMTIPPVISILGSMIGGDLADKVGRRPVMLVGAVFQSIMFAIFAFSNFHWINYLAFIGIGFGKSLYRPASDAMVADLVPESERRQVFATFITGNNIGAVLGPALGAFFFFHYRSELMWTCTIILFVYSIIIYLKINESISHNQKKVRKISNISKTIIDQLRGYGIIFHDKIFVLYIMAGVFSTITIMQLDLYLAIYITNYVPSQTLVNWNNWSFTLKSTDALGWILGLNGLLFVFCVLPLTKWLKNWNDRNLFILSSILAGFGMFAVGLTTNIWLLFVLTIIFTFGEIVRSPITNNFVSSYAPENARGQYMAASSLQFTIGRFFAPITVFVSAWLPPIAVFSVILLCAFISIILYNKLFKVYKPTK